MQKRNLRLLILASGTEDPAKPKRKCEKPGKSVEAGTSKRKKTAAKTKLTKDTSKKTATRKEAAKKKPEKKSSSKIPPRSTRSPKPFVPTRIDLASGKVKVIVYEELEWDSRMFAGPHEKMIMALAERMISKLGESTETLTKYLPMAAKYGIRSIMELLRQHWVAEFYAWIDEANRYSHGKFFFTIMFPESKYRFALAEEQTAVRSVDQFNLHEAWKAVAEEVADLRKGLELVEDVADRLERAAKSGVSEFQEYIEKATSPATALKAIGSSAAEYSKDTVSETIKATEESSQKKPSGSNKESAEKRAGSLVLTTHMDVDETAKQKKLIPGTPEEKLPYEKAKETIPASPPAEEQAHLDLQLKNVQLERRQMELEEQLAKMQKTLHDHTKVESLKKPIDEMKQEVESPLFPDYNDYNFSPGKGYPTDARFSADDDLSDRPSVGGYDNPMEVDRTPERTSRRSGRRDKDRYYSLLHRESSAKRMSQKPRASSSSAGPRTPKMGYSYTRGSARSSGVKSMKVYDQKKNPFYVCVRNAVDEGFFTFKSFYIFMDEFFKKTYKAQTWVIETYFVYAAKPGLLNFTKKNFKAIIWDFLCVKSCNDGLTIRAIGKGNDCGLYIETSPIRGARFTELTQLLKRAEHAHEYERERARRHLGMTKEDYLAHEEKTRMKTRGEAEFFLSKDIEKNINHVAFKWFTQKGGNPGGAASPAVTNTGHRRESAGEAPDPELEELKRDLEVAKAKVQSLKNEKERKRKRAEIIKEKHAITKALLELKKQESELRKE